MGERALAGVQCGDDVEVYRAQWAGREELLAAVFDSRVETLDALAGAGWEYRGRCDPVAFPRTVDALAVSVVYLVSTGGVRVYLPVWPGFSRPTGAVADGVLVRVGTLRGCRRLRRLVRCLKGVYHDAVARGGLDTRTARELLADTLRSDCAPGRVHTPGTPL